MIKLFRILFLVLILFTSILQASFEPKGLGIPYLAAGGTSRASELKPFAVFINPASLNQIQGRSVHLFYKNYYELENLNLMALEARFRPFGLPLGIGVSRYGDAAYQEADLRVGTALRLVDVIDLGISLNLYSVYLKNYGHSATAGVSIAANWAIFKTFSAAMVINNLNEPKLGAAKDRIPLQMAVGLSWKIIPDLEILFDLVKEEDFDFDFRTGVNYKLDSWFILHAGFRTLTPIYSTGFTAVVGAFQLGYAFEYHVELSGSHSIGAGYVF